MNKKYFLFLLFLICLLSINPISALNSDLEANTDTFELNEIIKAAIPAKMRVTGGHPSKKLASGHLGRVIQRCTQISPGRRYKNVLRLMEDIR